MMTAPEGSVRKRILVVDDDRGMVDTLADILDLHGWTTYRAYDGADAVRAIAGTPVDVVLMDVRMPGLNGVEALREIRARWRGVRVVLMTAYAAQQLLAQGERNGALAILRKPVEIGPLLSLLEAAVSRSVLIVDDDPDYLRTMSDALERRGVVAMQARSLDEAASLLRRDTPGVVLLDLKLNGVDSGAHLLELRRLSATALLVLNSGYPERLAAAVSNAPEGLVSGAFAKPLDIERLLEFLNAAD